MVWYIYTKVYIYMYMHRITVYSVWHTCCVFEQLAFTLTYASGVSGLLCWLSAWHLSFCLFVHFSAWLFIYIVIFSFFLLSPFPFSHAYCLVTLIFFCFLLRPFRKAFLSSLSIISVYCVLAICRCVLVEWIGNFVKLPFADLPNLGNRLQYISSLQS